MQPSLPITIEQIETVYPEAIQLIHVSKGVGEFCGIFATKKEAIRYVVEHVLDELDERPMDEVARIFISDLLDRGYAGGRDGRWVLLPLVTHGSLSYDRFDGLYDEIQAGKAVSTLLAEAESSSGDEETPEAPPPRRRAPRTPYRPIF